MENTTEDVLEAVKRKLNITWDDPGTDDRITDVIQSVSPRLASRLGLRQDHTFSAADGQAWGLFLNACLYEFSDAWDDFSANYRTEIDSARLILVAGDVDA